MATHQPNDLPPVQQPLFQGWIGVARQDITPPVGIYARNWGAAKQDVAEGIHRPMTLTALTLQEEKGAAPLVLIAADLCWWREESTERSVREPLLKALQLDAARLMLNLSHTHSGPAVSPAFAGLPGGDKIAGYLERVRAAALAAVQAALKGAEPALLEWSQGRCDLACNRDLGDPGRPADRARVVCGFNPNQAADDTVLVGRVTTTSGSSSRVLATVVNYACHPVTLAWENRLISPDYVGAMREVVETATAAPCLFLQGASGELAPAQEYVGDVAIADGHGRRLGHAALAALEGMLPAGMELAFTGVVESGAPLATWAVRPRSDVAGPSKSRRAGRLRAVATPTAFMVKKEYPPVAEIERQLAEAIAQQNRVLGERLRRKLAVRQSLGDGTHATFYQWLWQVGEALVVGVPNEAYSQLQLDLRRRFAPMPVVTMNLVNGSTGYLPPLALYSQDVYQVWQSPFEAGCLEQAIGACEAGLAGLLGEHSPTLSATSFSK